MPKLSICIPTYNRLAYLREAVDSVLSQAEGQDIELVISDNASSDGTEEYVSNLKDKTHVPLVYHRNEQNFGFDRNILKIVELAQGEYCWILGDDDLALPGALRRLVDHLKQADGIDLLFFEKSDFYLETGKPMKERKVMDYPVAARFNFHDDKTMAQYFHRQRKLIAYCNYLSNIVFSRARWQQVANKLDFVGTAYIHLYVFQSILWGRQRGVMAYCPDLLVNRRWGNDGLTDPEKRLRQDVEMYHGIAKAVFADPKYVRMIDALVIKNDGFSWAVRLKINKEATFYAKTFPFLLQHYWSYSLFWLKIFPLLFLPAMMLRVMRNVYRLAVKGEKMTLADLVSNS